MICINITLIRFNECLSEGLVEIIPLLTRYCGDDDEVAIYTCCLSMELLMYGYK